jgi:ATP-dependent RNA helicase RhlE
VSRQLAEAAVAAEAIHGNKSQSARQQALASFKDGRVRILVATDIAARGIDVDGVTHVINYDLPSEPEAYVHRIGRTARAGRSGSAISFCQPEERDLLRRIEKLTRQPIPVVAEHRYAARGEAAAVPAAAPARKPQRRRFGRRGQGAAGRKAA